MLAIYTIGDQGYTYLEWVLSAIINIIKVLMHKLHTLIEVSLVEAGQVSAMNLKPTETALAEGLSIGEEQQSARQIITNMVQVGRNRVCTATEVKVVWEVECIGQEL
jgi:hypothetical protein